MGKKKEKEMQYIKLEAKDHDLPCNHGENIYPSPPFIYPILKNIWKSIIESFALHIIETDTAGLFGAFHLSRMFSIRLEPSRENSLFPTPHLRVMPPLG